MYTKQGEKFKRAYVILFELSISFGFAITLGFWTAIVPALIEKQKELDPEAKEPEVSPALLLSILLDHSLPLTCLVLDYTFNQMPLIAKHAFTVGVAGFLYSMVNLAYVKF